MRVGVLRGGPSREYEVSLKTGATVLQHLPDDRFEPLDIFIDKEGIWHLRGRPLPPERILAQVDVAFVGLHGAYGEDGRVQRLLEAHGVPFTGSRALASALAMHKARAKEIAARHGIPVAPHRVVHFDVLTPQLVTALFRTFPQPSVIKPLTSGSSDAVTIAWSFDDFVAGFEKVFIAHDAALVEQYLEGKEATCGVVEHFRGAERYVLPEIEIRPRGRAFFDYTAKYEGAAEEICPGNFTREEKEEIARLAKKVHEALGLQHYSRSDFIVTRRGVFFLEVNTLPGLTSASLMPKALGAVGCTLSDFLSHVVGLAQRRTVLLST